MIEPLSSLRDSNSLHSSQDFLQTFNFEEELTVPVCQLSLVAMYIVCLFLAFLALKRLVTKPM